MKKRLYIFLTIVHLIFNLFGSTANANYYGETIVYEKPESDYISRCDAVTYIVYSIGHSLYDSIPFSPTIPHICDYYHINVDSAELIPFLQNTNVQFVHAGDKTMAAIETCEIMYGYGECGEHPYGIRVQPLKATTVNEALAFMVRCLEEKSDKLLDLDYVMELARQKGLILETDSFYSDVHKPLTFDEFRTLLSRFMNQAVYLQAYFLGDVSRSNENFTYYELLESKYGKGYPERILALKGYDWINDYFGTSDAVAK